MKPLNIHKIPLVLPDTVEACHVIIKDLIKLIEQSHREMSARMMQLEQENQALKERLGMDSHNSSKPPSTDFKKNKKKKRSHKGSGKSSGGQPGHKGHYRELLPESEVDQVVPCELPRFCEDCGAEAVTSNGKFVRHQVHELPPLKLEVTEYRLARGRCQSCQHHQVAPLPEGVTRGITGPRLTSWMSLLVSHYQLSRRQLRELLQDHWGFKLSLGTVFNKQRLVSQALAMPVNDLLPEVKKKPCHMDETSHNRDGERQWLWGMATSEVAYFQIEPSRGKQVAMQLLSGFQSILITDRYSAYNGLSSSQRQLCWAHLKRDFIRFAERRAPVIRRLGKELLALESQVFALWHAFKSGDLTREQLIWRTQPLRKQIGETLEKGSYTAPELRMARFCKNLLTYFHALWTFLEVEGVEPTNNHAERQLRPWVIWRKKYFATRSDYGTDFVARSASVNATCRLQQKNLWEYMAELMTQTFAGKPAPPLITAT